MILTAVKILFAALFIVTLFSANGHSATLNTKINLEGDVLTVGDVFHNAESHADHVLGQAPPHGDVMILDNRTLSRIADGFGINWQGRTPAATARVKRVSAVENKADPEQVISVPVLVEPANRDTVISAADIVRIDVPAKKLADDTVLDENEMIGKSARGLIQPKTPVSKNLLVAPKVIKRGDLVTLNLSAGRIQLSSKGKALTDARMGELVRLENPGSKKIVQARVTGPQEAVIEPQL